MVTDQSPGHDDQFEELAAGYALDALDPADEQTFVEHAADCPDCTRIVASYREVAAAIASVVPPAAEPSPQLADRIMATVRAGAPAPSAGAAPVASDTAAAPAQEEPAAEVVPLRSRRRWLRPAAAAAAVAAIVGGIWGGLAATSGTSAPTIANCQSQQGCYQTALALPHTTRQTAKVLVQGKNVWVVPTGMTVDNSADQIYVLWQITAGGTRLVPLGGFDVSHTGVGSAIKVGSLSAPYHGTDAFAISLEPGRKLPAKPTTVVAIGNIS